MFKFFKKHPPKEGEGRERLKKELFDYRKCVDHGFPSKPSALAYDPKLNLLAIGTKSGAVKIYGAPGVEFGGLHENDVSVVQMFFLQEQGRVVSVCSDNSLHLWEVNLRSGKSVLDEVNEIFLADYKQMKAVSTSCLSLNGDQLLLGTEGGSIHMLDMASFSLVDQFIHQDVVMQNVPDDFKVNPGAVEAIAVHPTNPNKASMASMMMVPVTPVCFLRHWGRPDTSHNPAIIYSVASQGLALSAVPSYPPILA